jgi:fused signal recognition particle receptor
VAEETKPTLMARLKRGLFMTHNELIARVGDAIRARFSPDPKALGALEEALLAADVGPATAAELVEAVRVEAGRRDAGEADVVRRVLKAEIERRLAIPGPPSGTPEPGQPRVVLMVGVNGTGKTTTAAKLAARAAAAGKKPVLAAADTFRAAAIDQLKVWSSRADVPMIAGQPGSDPAAVAYDTIRAARARGQDMVIIDTAGRLHTKYNLMKELEKVHGVLRKSVHQAPHDVLLVLDAPTGQNALTQAAEFKKSVGVTGVVLTKLDSTAKGGMVFAIYRDLGLPLRFIGTGERIEDLAPFDADQFIAGLFE